jgi:hypothetical protein
MKLILSFALVILSLGIFSCKKEKSLENSKVGSSAGSLQSESTGECLPKNLQGVYVVGTALGSTNYIEVDIDVTTAGSYAISSDTINGYYFAGSGEFANTGSNTVKLVGKGKPLADGIDIFTVSFDSTSCNFDVAVLPANAGAPATFALQTSGTICMNSVVTGDYKKAVALTSSNKVDIQVNVTTVGSYSISTAATNGMTFSASGVFTNIGIQTVSLRGSGTPVNEGSIVIPVTVGNSTCSFTVAVTNGTTNPPTGIYFWKFTAGGKVHQGTIDGDGSLEAVSPAPGFTFTTVTFSGISNSADTSLALAIADLDNTINVNETYVSTSTTSNSAAIELDYGGVIYQADPQTAGATLTAKVTTHNTSTKVMGGTFSGTLKDSIGGQTLIITNGEFNFHYQ